MIPAMIPARLIRRGDVIWIDDEFGEVTTVSDHHSYLNPRITINVVTSQGKEKRATFSPNEIVNVRVPRPHGRKLTPKEIRTIVNEMPEYGARRRGNTWSIYEGDKPLLHNLKEWSATAIVSILNGESSWEGMHPAMQTVLIQSAIERGVYNGLETEFEDIPDFRIDKRVTGDVSIRDLRSERHWIVKIDEVTKGG